MCARLLRNPICQATAWVHVSGTGIVPDNKFCLLANRHDIEELRCATKIDEPIPTTTCYSLTLINLIVATQNNYVA